MKKILHLTLKKKWFDMELSGEKPEEYREIKDYWIDRLVTNAPSGKDFFFMNPFEAPKPVFESFDIVRATNGYGADKPSFDREFKGIEIRTGNSEWGATPGKKYFVIKLGEILEKRNIKGGE